MTPQETIIREHFAAKPGYLKKNLLKTLAATGLTTDFIELARSIRLQLRPKYYKYKGRRNTSARILVFDIETAPLLSYHWRRWDQTIFSDQTVEDNWPILTWSAKWLFEDRMYSSKMTPAEARNRDDSRVVNALWKFIDEADILIAHNGLKFDVRMMQARFFLNGLPPTRSFQVIDTLRATRRAFALPSNKLDDIAKYLHLEGKIKTDFTWWTKFMDGEQEAIDRMQEYNDKDVYVLEEVYFALRPWIKPHPNLGLFKEGSDPGCPACGSEDMQIVGEYATYVNTYDEHKCNSCGHHSRTRTSNSPIGGRRPLNVSIPN